MSVEAKPTPPFAETLPLVNAEPDHPLSPADVSRHQAAVEAALRVLRADTQQRLAAIPVGLAERMEKAARGNPAKRQQREADAVRWADDTHILVTQAFSDRESELLTQIRALELGALEARRGGAVMMITRDIETPILKDGAQVWRRGRRQTKREVINRPHVTARDGLETLATAHLKANGEPVLMRDGRTPMPPLFNVAQLAALHAYRIDYQAKRETSLPAVDTGGAGEDRTPFNIMRSNTLENLYIRGQASVKFGKVEAKVSRLAGREALLVLRAVAGEGHTIRSLATNSHQKTNRRRAIRLTRALLRAADLLAYGMGLQ